MVLQSLLPMVTHRCGRGRVKRFHHKRLETSLIKIFFVHVNCIVLN